MHNREPKKIIIYIIGIVLFSGIAVFSYLKYKPMIEGPLLEDVSLEPWLITEQSSVHLKGRVRNTTSVTINQRPITLNENLEFSEVIGLNPGKNHISLILEDIFEKERIYSYTVYSTHDTVSHPPTYQEAKMHMQQEQKLQENTGITETSL